MSMKNTEMHVVAGVGAVLPLAVFFVLSTVFGFFESSRADDGPKLEDKLVIEASLARRTNKSKVLQPKKDLAPAEKTKKPDGVSRDDKKKIEDKKPEEKQPDEKEPVLDPKDLPKRPRDDQETGPVNEPFNPNESTDVGNDPVTKGDPYFGKLKNDMQYNPPEIAKGSSVPEGCIRLEPDGTISDTKFDVKTDDDLQIAAEAALRQLVKARRDKPEEVPAHLLKFTKKWLCFKFTVASP